MSARLLLNEFRRDDTMDAHDIGKKRRSTGSASGSCPSAGPPSPRICHQGCVPAVRCAAFPQANVSVHRAPRRRVSYPYHRMRRKPMQTSMATTPGPSETQPRKTPRMVRLTVNLPSHLVEQMRDAVYWTPGLTLAWMIARAARASLTELETVHQGPFPRRLKPLRAGRPRLVGQSMGVRLVTADESPSQGTSVIKGPVPVDTAR